MKKWFKQTLIVAVLLGIAQGAAIHLLEQYPREIYEPATSLLKPWAESSGLFNGSIPLGTTLLTAAVIIYSLLAGIVLVTLFGMLRKRSKGKGKG